MATHYCELYKEGETVTVELDATYSAGDVFLAASNRCVILLEDGDNGDSAEAALGGVWDVPKATGSAWAIGDALYWDSSAENFTEVSTGNTFAGQAMAVAASNATRGKLLLSSISLQALILDNEIADPGDAGAIPVTASGRVPLVTGGAETRTLAAPSFAGQMLQLEFKTDAGNCVITCATGVNQTGNNTITGADAGDHLLLSAIEVGANLRWRVVANDGWALSTV
jgi:predicted RecA/RadA family phage recombinase